MPPHHDHVQDTTPAEVRPLLAPKLHRNTHRLAQDWVTRQSAVHEVEDHEPGDGSHSGEDHPEALAQSLT